MSDKHMTLDRRRFLATAALSTGMAAYAGKARASETAQAGGSGMKITAIKTYLFNVPTGQTRLDPKTQLPISSPFKTWLFLKLQTNAGLDGWGEGSGEWISPIVRTALDQWEELLVGRDPLDVTALCVTTLPTACRGRAGRSWAAPSRRSIWRSTTL